LGEPPSADEQVVDDRAEDSGQKIIAQARSMRGSPTVVISKSTTQAIRGGAVGAQMTLSTL
jgi:hypothetical protein